MHGEVEEDSSEFVDHDCNMGGGVDSECAVVVVVVVVVVIGGACAMLRSIVLVAFVWDNNGLGEEWTESRSGGNCGCGCDLADG